MDTPDPVLGLPRSWASRARLQAFVGWVGHRNLGNGLFGSVDDVRHDTLGSFLHVYVGYRFIVQFRCLCVFQLAPASLKLLWKRELLKPLPINVSLVGQWSLSYETAPMAHTSSHFDFPNS